VFNKKAHRLRWAFLLLAGTFKTGWCCACSLPEKIGKVGSIGKVKVVGYLFNGFVAVLK
jgi:hypothetical protein